MEDESFIVKETAGKEIFFKSKFSHANFYTKMSCKITGSMAFIAGVVVGDGHLHFNKSGGKMVEISVIDKNSVRLIKNFMESTFSINVKAKAFQDKRGFRVKIFRIRFSNIFVWSLLNSVFEIPHGKKSYIVKMPECVKRDGELSKMFISGLMLADGGTKHNSISFTTTSRHLFADVKSFMSKMGIIFTTRTWMHPTNVRIFDIIINRNEEKNKFLILLPILNMKFAGVA